MNILQGTVDLTRTFSAPVKTVYAAWSDEAAQAVWGHPGEGWSMCFDQFHFAVGQTDICRFGPKGGSEYINENRYLAIHPARWIVYSTSLTSAGRVNFAGTVAVTFESVTAGTEMHLIETGIYVDDLDNVDDHLTGWQSMLDALGSYLDRAG